MDADFDKYEPAAAGTAGAGGASGMAGSAGNAGVGGTGGSGGCEPLLTINEIQTDGNQGPEDEFVELFNASACRAALDQYELVYRSSQATVDHGVTWSGEAGQFLEPWSFFVVAGPSFPQSPDATFPNGLSLGASGGGLAIRNGQLTVDQVGWGDATNGFIEGEAAPAPGSNEAIGRRPDGHDTNDNIEDFAVIPPSPGLENPA